MVHHYRMRVDVLLCLGLAYLISMGTGKVAELVSATTYDSYVEAHTAAPGEIGGEAGEEVFRAQNIEDLLTHDTFTVVSPGIEYRNRGGGYYDKGAYLYALTLPSGELVAAEINQPGVQELGEDLYLGDNILPVGKVVWEDLSQHQTFLDQIQYSLSLSRTDFYIDMMGNGGAHSLESYTQGPAAAVQIATWVICFPLLHALGAKIGIFPYFFLPKKLRKPEWD